MEESMATAIPLSAEARDRFREELEAADTLERWLSHAGES